MVYNFGIVDVKEYIASGILESVALGFASEQEMQEVKCLSHIYPEIAEELRAIEASLEKAAFDTAIAPNRVVKERLMTIIAQTPQEQNTPPAKEGKVVSMQPSTNSANPWKWMAAASILLLVGIGTLWITTLNKSKDLSGQVAKLESKEAQNEQVIAAMQVEKDHLDAMRNLLSEHDVQKVMLMGTPKDPKACIHFMWSKDKNQGMMMAECITDAPKDMQYQLWAIVDNKPVSLGLFDHEELMNATEPFDVTMDNVAAFAITVEKRGGVASPTMENMVVIGNTQG